MTEEGFNRFCVNFKIFPDILPEEKVKQFYDTLSEFYSEGKESDTPPTIDEHLFIETLALSALEMKFQDPQPSQIEKVIVLIDCMNNTR